MTADANTLDLNVANLRKVRSEEQWERYDTIAIGPGASAINTGWYENFRDFANASNLIWFTSGRTKSVGESFCNLSGQDEDFAQRVFQSGVEFLTPPGLAGFEDNIGDAGFLQTLFTQELPNYMRFGVKMSDVDNVLRIPGSHLPAGYGVSGMAMGGAGSLFTIAGHTGDANIRNTWSWPHALGIPAKSKIEFNATIDDPFKTFLRNLPTTLPGQAQIPTTDENGEFALVPYDNWYRIRIWNRGPRYVQLRGARSAG
jgi:hypothetical protein